MITRREALCRIGGGFGAVGLLGAATQSPLAPRSGALDGTRGAGAREGRLVFAGGDLSPTAPGTLEGAVATGRAAAQEIAALLDAG